MCSFQQIGSNIKASNIKTNINNEHPQKNTPRNNPQRPFLPVAPIESQWTLFCSTGIVPGKVMEWPGTVRPAALWIALLEILCVIKGKIIFH